MSSVSFPEEFAVRGLRIRNVVARGLMHPVVSAPRPGLVSDISFVDCRFTRIDICGVL